MKYFSLYTDQVLKEHIDSLPAKRKKAHRRASRHTSRLKSKRRPSLPPPSIQSAAEVHPLTSVSRGSVSSTRTARSVDMTADADSGKSMGVPLQYISTHIHVYAVYIHIIIVYCSNNTQLSLY